MKSLHSRHLAMKLMLLIFLQFLCRRLSLQFKKRVRYDSRQRVASSRLRVKGRFVPLSEMASSGVVDVGGSGEQNQ